MASFVPVQKLIELLKAADKAGASYAQIESNRLSLGADPMKPTCFIDISRETIEPYRNGQVISAGAVGAEPYDEAPRLSRRSGAYWVEVMGKRTSCWTVQDILKQGLLAIEVARPGTFEKLTHIKPRSRRIVARDPDLLFDNKKLVKGHAQKLADGWWFGTNNSANETDRWLERACSCAELDWKKDCKTNLLMEVSLDDLA